MNAHAYQAPGLAPQELYFHYDALGNTTLLTDANANPKASFQYDLHTGRLINSWNPSNLEIINLEEGIVGSINITASTAIGKDIILPPRQPPNLGGSTNGDNWGTAQVYVGGNASGVQVDLTHPNFGKDCGDKGMRTMGKKNKDCYETPYDEDGNPLGNERDYYEIDENGLKDQGFNDFEIDQLKDTLKACKDKGGSFINCVSIHDINNFAKCCLQCWCSNDVKGGSKGGYSETICEDRWHIRPPVK